MAYMNNRNNRNNSNARNRNTLPSRASNAPRLPLSGSEEPFNDLSLFSARRGKGNNNCYSWAIGQYSNSGETKLQPGNLSQSPGDLDLKSCSAIRLRTLADLKGKAYLENPEKPCRQGYYKVMAFLAKDNDYHWYKQHKDAVVRMTDKMRDLAALARALGVSPKQLVSPSAAPKPGDVVLVKDAGVWSHKQGFATPPLLRDACGKVITDPRRACRDYGSLNYTEHCGSFCIKNRSTA